MYPKIAAYIPQAAILARGMYPEIALYIPQAAILARGMYVTYIPKGQNHAGGMYFEKL